MSAPVATILRASDVVACPFACGDLFDSFPEAARHVPECPQLLARPTWPAVLPWGKAWAGSPFTAHRAHPATEHEEGGGR